MQDSKNTKPKLFILGATGYIGGSFLTKLLASPAGAKWDITALTRKKESFPKFKRIGVTPLFGTLDDAEILKNAASEADITMNFSSCDHFPSVEALVAGLSAGSKRRVFIHTSGTAEISDDSKGEFTSEKVYSDLDVDAIQALPSTQPHRKQTEHIWNNLQNFESIIVAPPNIYGVGSGLFNQDSVQIPMLTHSFLKRGAVATLGKGETIWNTIHIDDLIDFYLILLDKAWEGKATTGRDGWYFVETGEFKFKDVITEIRNQLIKHGSIKNEEIGQFTPEEVKEYFPSFGWENFGGNSRSKSDRARALGWKPSGKRESIFESIPLQVVRVLAEDRE